MSRVCELTGKGRQVGNNVSHANNKTKRTFLPNLQNVTLISDALGQSVKLRVSTHGLRSVEHVGGLDNWLLKTSDDKLSPKVRKLKREITKKAAEAGSESGGDGGLLLGDLALEATGAQRQAVVLGLEQPVVEAADMLDRAQAVGGNAQLYALAQRIGDQRDVLQVRQKGPLGLVVGMGHVVAHLAALAGQLADARHCTSS